jgi:hypothetical protein
MLQEESSSLVSNTPNFITVFVPVIALFLLKRVFQTSFSGETVFPLHNSLCFQRGMKKIVLRSISCHVLLKCFNLKVNTVLN